MPSRKVNKPAAGRLKIGKERSGCDAAPDLTALGYE